MGFNHSAQLSLLALGGSISSLLGAIDSIRGSEASRARQEATNKWRTEYARIQEQKAQNDTKRLELRERAVQVNEKLADLQAQKTEAYINKANADTELKKAKAAKLKQQVKKAKANVKGETSIKKTPKVEALEEVKEKYQKVNKQIVEPKPKAEKKPKESSKLDYNNLLQELKEPGATKEVEALGKNWTVKKEGNYIRLESDGGKTHYEVPMLFQNDQLLDKVEGEDLEHQNKLLNVINTPNQPLFKESSPRLKKPKGEWYKVWEGDDEAFEADEVNHIFMYEGEQYGPEKPAEIKEK